MIGVSTVLALGASGPFLAIAASGPDLALIDKAVAACDVRSMTRTFSDEPARRRAFVIAAFNEQQAIMAARSDLAARREAALDAPALVPADPAGALMPPPQPDLSAYDREQRLLTERQRELDDARMLNGMREQALDMMRQQYLLKCSGGRTSAQD